MIELIFDIISLLIAGAILIWFILFLGKHYAKKKGNRKLIKDMDNLDLRMRKIGGYFLSLVLMFLKAILCVVLAIGTKPIIYKLNQPLGWGYATFASYMIAIGLWMLLPDIWKRK